MTQPGPGEERPEVADEMRELARLFLATRRADLDRLDAALAAGDFEAIRAVGHVFHGSSAPFGFPEAGRIGALLEEAAARGERGAVEALVARLRACLPPDAPATPGGAG